MKLKIALIILLILISMFSLGCNSELQKDGKEETMQNISEIQTSSTDAASVSELITYPITETSISMTSICQKNAKEVEQQTSQSITSAIIPKDISITTSPKKFAPDYLPGNSNITGNNFANLVDGGIATTQGDWIYYVGKTYKNSYTESDGKYSSFHCNDNLYEFNYLTKMKKDGTGKQIISKLSVESINVVKDWIYYLDECGALYKIRTDGTQNTKLLDKFTAWSCVVINDWIYYIDLKRHLTIFVCFAQLKICDVDKKLFGVQAYGYYII